MISKIPLYFDAKDWELLTMVNRFLERDSHVPEDEEYSFFHVALHPRGIKQLAMSQEIRVAYAVINLLDTLEMGQMQDRINALRTLHNEVLYSASPSFRYNTGRVLIQIMKSLVRAQGNTENQLRLAHDFRRAASGRRRVVRQMLRRCYLLEMPETWNQQAFDNHVHDANTKGRKSPTQLIMDAWIKGLRKLDVVYYNFVEPDAVAELLQAADIVGIRVRVGVEFQACFHDRFVQFTWQPRGFSGWQKMLEFFQEKPVQHLMRMGREASLYHHNYVMQLLYQYNTRLRFDLGGEFDISLAEIPEQEILAFVGIGQTSRTHLAELVYRRIRSGLAGRMTELRSRYTQSEGEERKEIDAFFKKTEKLSPDAINYEWFSKSKNPQVLLPIDPRERDKIPEIMRLLPSTLMDWLTSIHASCHITLNLCDLTVKDVLELLYDCHGAISHLEIYNLKNYEDGRLDIEGISELQTAINEGSTVALKRLIRHIVSEFNCSEDALQEERCQIFLEILRNIPKLQEYYSNRPLGARVGSDSTSRTSKMYGMGFAFLETLPPRARKELREKGSVRRMIPITQEVYSQVTYYPKRLLPLDEKILRLLRRVPGSGKIGLQKCESWQIDAKTARYSKDAHSITTLGGFQGDQPLAFSLEEEKPPKSFLFNLHYMNTTVKNFCKVAMGFALTMATFLYTQTWWVLAWFGPFIWFGITGFRNMIQGTLGGGGLRRTPLLTWNDYISWSRLSDSLLYTGISVPLLEYGVRILLLGKTCSIDSLSNPLLFYSIMSMVNGLYIASHNIYRGLPQEAVIGNLFRSILAIPVSIFYNYIGEEIFVFFQWPMVYFIEVATVLSKLASDTVAAIIEGFADKMEYLRMRHLDYSDKMRQLLRCYARLEVLMPEEDVLELLRRPKEFIRTVGKEAAELEKVIIVNALDFMYLWWYQPRARTTLVKVLSAMTQEECEIWANVQLVLTRVHEISQMLVDGLVGKDFVRPLAFYLGRHEEYLRDMAKLTSKGVLE